MASLVCGSDDSFQVPQRSVAGGEVGVVKILCKKHIRAGTVVQSGCQERPVGDSVLSDA